jgi:23S rRNA (adenine-N6)-dimethyltransferase
VGDQRLRPRGRHFLAPALAADFVRNSGVTRGDLVVEIGAGNGVITRELRARAGRVTAIELDPALARASRALNLDVLDFVWPRLPFRVVANLPFAHTTPILRHLLDDPSVALMRADVIVGWGWAAKRCSQRPSTLLTMSWGPWFELTITRRIAAQRFHPVPSTDAAVVTITRRPDELLPVREAKPWRRFLEQNFGCRRDATDLDVSDWKSIYLARARKIAQ